jgi:hypothetical protein
MGFSFISIPIPSFYSARSLLGVDCVSHFTASMLFGVWDEKNKPSFFAVSLG